MDINSAKGIVLATLFVVTLISCLLPFKLADTIQHTVDPAKKRRYVRIMSLLNCFAGGVFLGTCLLDLFPEVQDSISDVLDKLHIDISFPTAEFLVAIGLFLVLIVEQISLDCKLSSSRIIHVHEEQQPLIRERGNIGTQVEISTSGYGSTPINENPDPERLSISSHSQEMASNSALRSLLLLVALSLHSVFEGLAIGLQANVESVLQIFAAVVLHKCVIAFGLSLNLVQSDFKKLLVIQLILIFCLAAPIGLGIGMAVMEVSNSLQAAVASGVLQGLACGTFLYVTFFEVLPHELHSSDLRMPKLLFILLGFSSSCAILFLDPDTTKSRHSMQSNITIPVN